MNLIEQYQSTKQEYPGVIQLYRVGDFYEAFFEDAETVSRELGLTLTGRNLGESRVAMTGFPYHSMERHVSALIAAGHKVAICEQAEDPHGKKPEQVQRFTREVQS